jgi:hypothetical protein
MQNDHKTAADFPNADTTAKELAEFAKRGRPHVRYAYDTQDSAVAAWAEDSDHGARFVMVAGRTIVKSLPWVECRYEILVDGKPVPREWIEV